MADSNRVDIQGRSPLIAGSPPQEELSFVISGDLQWPVGFTIYEVQNGPPSVFRIYENTVHFTRTHSSFSLSL